MKSHARVVVVGGGIVGCSVLYHLAKMGWKDVVLLERSELTSGSSWHAAGNLFTLTSPSSVQLLQKYTIELYPRIEAESGQPVGYHPTGGLHIASSSEERLGLDIERGRARRNGIDCEFISFADAMGMAPILDLAGAQAVLFEPIKGHVDPSSATHAYAAAARKLGATIHRQTTVVETNPTADGAWEVVTTAGTIKADMVVNAAGLWAREVGALAGIVLPLVPVEHHYLVTEMIPEIAAMGRELPTIGDAEAGYYSRQEGQGLLLGAYEDVCHHWAVDGTPLDFGHELLPNDLSRMEKNFEKAVERMSCLGAAGIKRIINGPMIFSPDLAPLIGPYPTLRNYYCACGVMTGFNQAGGVGRVLAEWMIEGEPSLDIAAWDAARFGPWADAAFTRARTKYFYEHRTRRTRPHEEFEAGRPLQTLPTHERLKAAGAVFGFSYGREAPLWYARSREEARDVPSFRRANWFDAVGEESSAVRDGVGLIEISTFAKYEVTGPDAAAWLDRLLAGRVPVQVGRIALNPMLSPKGRIIGDFTVTRLSEGRFLLLGAGSMQGFHMRWFAAQVAAAGVQVRNRTDELSGLMIAGPRARSLLARLTNVDVSNDGFPFLSARALAVEGAADVTAVRVSFTGELGFELYCPAAQAPALFAALIDAGRDLGLRLVGSRALMWLRLEKSFPSWGLELSPDYTPMEPGLDRFVRFDKGDFIGRDAVLRAREKGAKERLAVFVVDTDDADCSGGEGVFKDGRYAGYITSGGYGHTVGESLALGYVKAEMFEPDGVYEIELLGARRRSVLHVRPRLDPEGARMRA